MQDLIDKTTASHEAKSGSERLWGWFGLSYASFLVLPRITMCGMPDDWQKRMAALLEEYDTAYPSHPDTECSVVKRIGRRLAKWPDWILDYRHPDQVKLDAARSRTALTKDSQP